MPKKCFVVSPIGEKNSKTRIHSDNLFNHLLTPVCQKNDISLIRVDSITTSTVITDDIYNHLDHDDLVIVDITELNPNVFLELGYRIAKHKAFIIIKDEDDQSRYPFDISNIRIMEYSLKLENLEESKNMLDAYLNRIDYSINNEVVILEEQGNFPAMKVVRRENGNISFKF